MNAAPEPVAVWYHLLQLHADLVEDLETVLRARHGLSVTEFDVLVNLSPRTPLRHRDLVERVVLTRSATTRLIDRLLGRGLVSREPDPVDQRGVRIALTPAGRELRRAAARTNAAVVRERFAGLPPEELHALDRILRRLRPHDAGDRTKANDSERANR